MKILIEESVVRQVLESLEYSTAIFANDTGIKEAIAALRSTLDASEKVEPNSDQLTQILNGLDRCHVRESKREFLRTWIRDFVQRKCSASVVPEVPSPPKVGADKPGERS